MDVMEAIRGRRSVRAFADRIVPQEQLLELIDAATWAPSGGNAQAWHFIVVESPERVQQISAVSPGIFGVPPAIIAVCTEPSRIREERGPAREALTSLDAAMATQNLLLMAHASGLGTCVIASFHKRAVAKLLALPEEVVPLLLVTVGWPAKESPAPPRRQDVVSLNTYNHAA